MRGLRDLFKNIRVGYIYRLDTGGVKASNDYATANYPGVRGNDLTVVVEVNVDNPGLFCCYYYVTNDMGFVQNIKVGRSLNPLKSLNFRIKSGVEISKKL